jgi:hypothetical protein
VQVNQGIGRSAALEGAVQVEGAVAGKAKTAVQVEAAAAGKDQGMSKAEAEAEGKEGGAVSEG